MEAKQCASNPYYQSKQKPAHKGAAAKCSIHSQIPLIPGERGEKRQKCGMERVCVGIKQGMKRIKRGNTDMI